MVPALLWVDWRIDVGAAQWWNEESLKEGDYFEISRHLGKGGSTAVAGMVRVRIGIF